MMQEQTQERILSEVEGDVHNFLLSSGVDLEPHGFPHVLQVVSYTEKICQGEKFPLFVSKLAALLHDVGRVDEAYGNREGIKVDHAKASASRVEGFLGKYQPDLGNDDIDTIKEAVLRHRRLNADDDSQVAIYLKEADRLSALGAIGIQRSILESAFFHRPWINLDNPFPDGPLKPAWSQERKPTGVEALLFVCEWHNMFRTPTGLALSRPLFSAVVGYLQSLAFETGTEDAFSRNKLMQCLGNEI